MNILYLHGLESKLSDEKRAILEKYGNVMAPDMDYKSNPNMIDHLYNTYRNQEIDVIIGSSMGGFSGYYLANILNVRCLLYNPALPYRNTTVQNIPSQIPMTNTSFMRIVLGAQDTIIKAKDNLAFLSQHMTDKIDYTVKIRRDLAHQIPVNVFEEETKAFFEM